MKCANDKTEKEFNTDKYIKAMKEVAETFKPQPMPAWVQPEPIRFSFDPGTLEVEKLAEEIMQVLDGHTLQEIVAASAVVEKYVAAQSMGQLLSYSPTYGTYGRM